MSQLSQPSISDLIGAATGISPKANPKQINEIAALTAERSQAEKVQEKLVKRLQKPRIYGLLCVYKTLYLVAKLLPKSHEPFRAYWIRNCGLFDKAYLNDAADPDEVQTCHDIKNISDEIKIILEQLNDGYTLLDTIPPEYSTIAASPEGRGDNPLPIRGTLPRPINSQRNEVNMVTSSGETLRLSTPSERVQQNATSESGITLNKKTSLETLQRTGTTPLPSHTPETTTTGLQTPDPSPSSLNNRSLLRKFLSPKTATPPLPAASTTRVRWTPTLSPLPLPSIPSSRGVYVPNKSVHIRDTLEIIDDRDLGSSTAFTETSSGTITGNVEGIEKTKFRKGGIGKAEDVQSILSTTGENPFRVSVVLTDQEDDLSANTLFQESVWDLTDCIKKVDPRPFARGGFANVWKGIYTRSNNGKPEEVVVAIKVPRGDHAKNENTKKLYQEVHTWQKLSHQNVAPFYGIYMFSNGLYGMVSPLHSKGHVIQFLKETKSDPIKLIFGMAKGVAYLHANGIIHGDLKGSNVLVDDNGHARLIDFGLAHIHDKQMMILGQLESNMETSLRWSAPELLKPASTTKVLKTEKSDVYAFASTAVEMMTLKPPYPHIKDRGALIRKICSGEYLERPKESFSPSDELWTLLKRCWHGRAEERPTIHQVIDELQLYVPRPRPQKQ